jgi:hypothetical protein
VNYIGEDYLKEHVAVHVYGNLDDMHPNLRDAFANLCKSAEMYEISFIQEE